MAGDVTDVCLLKHLRAELGAGGHFPYSMSGVRHKEGLAPPLLILEHQPASAAHGGESINLQLQTALEKHQNLPVLLDSPLSHPLPSARAAIRGFLPKS